MKIAAGFCLAMVACGGGSGGGAGGAFELEWEITMNAQPVDCADVGVIEVEFTSIDVDDHEIVDTFPCEAMSGTTTVRAAGTYELEVHALADDDTVLATGLGAAVVADGQPTVIAQFSLNIGTLACDSSSCPTGCCNSNDTCVEPQTDAACGRSGATCANCTTLGQVCNATEGLCID